MTYRFVVSVLVLTACGEAIQQEVPDAGVAVDGGGSGVPADADVPEEPPSFELHVQASQPGVYPGATSFFTIDVTRHGSFTGAVMLEAVGLPAGVFAPPSTVEPGEMTGTLALMTSATATHSLPTQVTISGTAGTLTASAVATVTVRGTPGALDQSFGKLLLPMGGGSDTAYATAVQPDGKIVVAGYAAGMNGGDFALTRLERDGAVDMTFGASGKVFTDFGGGFDAAYAIALQPDGKIVVAGMATVSGTSFDFAVARYNSDGSPDTTFSGDGKTTTALGTSIDSAYAVVVQNSGRIVLGGETYRSAFPFDTDFALVGYLDDGSLDMSFGASGLVITPVRAGSGRDAIFALGVERGGSDSIVAVGGDDDFAIARYQPNGQLDTTFGMQGLVTGVFQSTVGAAKALAIAPSGHLFVAGQINHNFAVVELTAAGAVALPFGRSITAMSSSTSNEAQAIALYGDQPVVAGWVYEATGTSLNFALLRLNPDGTLDNTFGNAGRVVTEMATTGLSDRANAIALQVDSRVPATRAIVVGSASDDFAIARYWQ